MDTQLLQTEIVELIKGINEEDKLLELKAHVEDLKTDPWWLHDKKFMKELEEAEKEYQEHPENFTDAFEFLEELKKTNVIKNAS